MKNIATRLAWVFCLLAVISVLDPMGFNQTQAAGLNASWDPVLVSPAVAPTSTDPTVDPVTGFIYFKSTKAVVGYFDDWRRQDDTQLAGSTLGDKALRMAYGDTWKQAAPTAGDARHYAGELHRKLFWAFLPGVTVAKTNVIGSTLKILSNPPAGQFPDNTLNTNLQTVYQLSWNVTDFFLKRTETSDTIDGIRSVQYKMRSDVLNPLSVLYATRQSSQTVIRACLIELSQNPGSDRQKELRKTLESVRSDLVKSNYQLDMATGGAATDAAKAYHPYETHP